MEKQQVKPYSADGGKKAQVEKMFDNIAPKYDLLNRVLSLGIDVSWRNKALSYLQKDQPRAILDVATGTADVAIMAAKQLEASTITGIDISNQMLDFGRTKIKQQGLENRITLETGDSEALRFDDNAFDAVTVAFGVRNFGDLEKGLSEMLRVLRPEGKAVILEFSRPSVFPFKQLYYFYFRYVLPLIGRLSSQDPRAYTYLFESSMAFPQGEDFLQILRGLGFREAMSKRLSLGICSIYIAKK